MEVTAEQLARIRRNLYRDTEDSLVALFRAWLDTVTAEDFR